MLHRGFRRAAVSVTAGTTSLGLVALLSGCGGGTPAVAATPSASPSAATPEPRAQLTRRVAAAKDKHYVIGYTLATPDQPARSVLVTIAADGTWRVDIQGGAMNGTANVSIAGRPEGVYQCTNTADAECVRVAAAGKPLPPELDPQVQDVFTSWLDVLSDRQTGLAVTIVALLPGASGTCFAVTPAVTAVAPPVDAGVLCYTDDGILTAARLPFGTLTIAQQPQPAPPTVVLPGPITDSAPLPMSAPPSPPSGSASPTT